MNVVAFIVAGSIGTLNVAVTILLSGTPVWASAGSVAVTKGATGIKVVKLQTKLLANGSPARFLAPVVMVPV